MNTINKIFSGKIDEEVHTEFLKFSRGLFENRYLLEAKKQKDRWALKTGYEFANFFVKKCIEKSKGEIQLSGVIVYTAKLEDSKIPIERVKQFMGVKQYVINSKVDSVHLLDTMRKYPKAFYALSFKNESFELKIKAKAPKSAKPSTKGEGEPKAEFCSLKTNDKSIIDDLFFDFPNFSEIKIKHALKIDSIELPKGVDDPVKLRELSKRKGTIIREVTIDGRKEKRECLFEV